MNVITALALLLVWNAFACFCQDQKWKSVMVLKN